MKILFYMIAAWESACIGHFPNYLLLWTMGTAAFDWLSVACRTPGFFRPSGAGGAATPPCNFKTAYAMAPKIAQNSVRVNSNHYRYCDVTVTCMASLWRHLLLNVSLRSSKAINLLNTVPEGVKILLLGMKGIYNIFSGCIFLEDMKLCIYISY